MDTPKDNEVAYEKGFKTGFKTGCQFAVTQIINMLDTRCSIYETAKAYDKMEAIERFLCDIKEICLENTPK